MWFSHSILPSVQYLSFARALDMKLKYLILFGSIRVCVVSFILFAQSSQRTCALFPLLFCPVHVCAVSPIFLRTQYKTNPSSYYSKV